jgi:serine/threonine protein kinase
MCDMLSAVRYLHEQGIAHRDLKLENFLFEQPGMHSPLKLIDFGLSKHFDPKESMHQVVGSAYYTAPEVLGGNYDFRCDIWSLVSTSCTCQRVYVHTFLNVLVMFSALSSIIPST